MSVVEAGADRAGGRKALRWAGIAILAALLAGVIAALSRPRGVPVQVVPVRRGDLVVPIQCDGTLEPPPGGEMRAADAATVGALLVHEGDRVEPGTPLLRLESPDLAQKALEARADALRLSAERDAAAADVAELERQVEHRSEVFEGDKRLLASGAITKMAYQSDELALREAEDRARAAKARLTGLEGTSRGGVSRVTLAEKAASELEQRAAALTVVSPAAGVVYGLPRRVGEAVAAGQVVANVIDPQHRRVRARIDQPDLPRVLRGQRAIVGFDGLPHEHWEGEVAFVAPGLREVGGREVGEVMVDVADPERRLPANAAVDLQIITGEKKSTLVIPRASVFRDGERRFVFVYDGGRARRREIEIGLLGLSEAEALHGLAENDRVILPGATPLTDGARVRATKA
jgi:multidrug efflux pump subunit AcrA (membrane-fusion protein)